jgi:hypothetical protein
MGGRRGGVKGEGEGLLLALGFATFGVLGRGRDDWFSGDLWFGDESDDDVAVCEGADAGRERDFADVEGAAEWDGGDIDLDGFREVFRETMDGEFVNEVFEETACFDPCGVAGEAEGDVGVDDLVFADGVEVEVDDGAGERVVLDVLEEGEFGLVGVLDGEVDEDLVGSRVIENGFDFFGLEADDDAGDGFPVDDAGDEAFAAEGIEGAGAAAFAAVGGEGLSFGHGCSYGNELPCGFRATPQPMLRPQGRRAGGADSGKSGKGARN